LLRVRAHQNNLQRYCRLLATELTETERQFIHNRIAEERAEGGCWPTAITCLDPGLLRKPPR